jgi:hypothetical protein
MFLYLGGNEKFQWVFYLRYSLATPSNFDGIIKVISVKILVVLAVKKIEYEVSGLD